MNVRYLEYFVAVMDHGGITRAAEACYVSQLALSQGLHKLEEELGAPLLRRAGRCVVLTPLGEALVTPARQLINGLRATRASIASVTGLCGESEVALSTIPANSERLKTFPLGIVRFAIAASAGLPLPEVLDPANAAEWATAQWISGPPGLPHRALLVDLYAALGLPAPQVRVVSRDPSAMVPAMVAGAGMTIITSDAVATARSFGARTCLIPPGILRRELWGSHPFGRISEPVVALVTVMKAHFRQA